jgi:hypothetical protein
MLLTGVFDSSELITDHWQLNTVLAARPLRVVDEALLLAVVGRIRCVSDLDDV